MEVGFCLSVQYRAYRTARGFLAMLGMSRFVVICSMFHRNIPGKCPDERLKQLVRAVLTAYHPPESCCIFMGFSKRAACGPCSWSWYFPV